MSTVRLWQRKGSKQWTVIVELGCGPDGKPRREWHGGFTKEGAKAAKIRFEHALLEGEHVARNGYTVGEWIEKWLKEVAPRSASPSTVEHYAMALRAHIIPDIGEHRLQSITPLLIQEEMARLAEHMAESSVRYHMSRLRMCLDRAVLVGLIKKNPARGFDLPSGRAKEQRALSFKETRDLLGKLEPTSLYLPALIAATTGMRRGEVLALRWHDINGNQVTITGSIKRGANGLVERGGTKTAGSKGTLTLSPSVLETLKNHRREQSELRLRRGREWHDNDLIICHPNGEPWDGNSLSVMWGRAMTRLGYDGVRFHDLRHTHATQCLAVGGNIKAVQGRLRHANSNQTMSYAHVMGGQDEALALAVDQRLGIGG